MTRFISLFFCLFLSACTFAQSDTFEDPRDGQEYGIKTIGNLVWMTENLRHQQDGMVCYNNDTKMCEELGGLYTFESARTACPTGWRLASDNDFKDLESALSIPKSELNYNDYMKHRGTSVGPRLKSGGNSGLELKISGYASSQGGKWSFDGIGGDRPRSYFWTSTTEKSNGETQVFRRRIEAKNGSIFRFSNPSEGYAISVRCVKNK